MKLIKNFLQIKSYKKLTSHQKTEVILSLSKPDKFFITFFENLPHAKTKAECFNKLNALHFEIWGNYMYSDYSSFQKCYKNYIYKRVKK